MRSILQHIFGRASSASRWHPGTDHADAIIRAELFSIERLEQHAASLAKAQSITSKPRSRRSLNARLKENESALLSAYHDTAATLADGHAISPAAEWLIDNFHLVEAQIRQIRDDLPAGYYRQLPKLANGPLAGYPRVFGIAWACIAHSDSHFDPEALCRFLRAYQKVQPLTIGELWAVTITLRIVLVENLRRAAERVVNSRVARYEADDVADRLLGVNGMASDPAALIRLHAKGKDFSVAFIVQLLKRLRDQDPQDTPALVWLESQLMAKGTTADDIVRDEHQRLGAANVTVRNIITSMRLISDLNWADFFEDVSLVDEALRSGSNFADLDFATRNLYRGAIEKLSRGSAHTELAIANAAIAAASARHDDPERETDPRRHDPGYHLLAAGLPAFERSIGFRAPLRSWPRRLNASIGPAGYIFCIALVTTLVLSAPLLALHAQGVKSPYLAILALLGLMPAIDVAVALVNRVVTGGFGATTLPALALRDGVPPQLRTMVVVPALLTTPAEIEAQIKRLEVHYLASSKGAVHFALLSDWHDAETENADGDAVLLRIAADGIARLNTQYGPVQDGALFHLLHRRRVWSDGQRRWMGWERKRGKLHELNRLLRGAADTTFVNIDGQTPAVPAGVRYVVTLDADTRLPRETVRRLIGKLAHPLNQAAFDRATGRVVEGYGVLQPRVTPSLPIGREGSMFQRIFSQMTGIDAYGTAAADVYQDLFGVGSYAGKGIYDVDAFESALADRVPDDSLLSHDLFEGTFARAGLVSDIEVIEEFPSRYDVAAMRSHRWARGDWQLLPWILGRRHATRGGGELMPLIGIWKMLDNLRRTMSAPASVVALLAGLLLPLDSALLWTAFVLTAIAFPIILPVLAAIAPRRRGVTLRGQLRTLGSDLWLALSQTVLVITFLAHQSWLMADAIFRTLFRLIVSRRNLLEWVTAAQAQRSARLDVAGVYRNMSASVVIALVALAAGWIGGSAWWLALPFAVLWIAAPAIARWISISPLVAGRLPVSDADSQTLRLVARRTWRFFETFVTADDHMLPPDNFQEDPHPILAHRTSPTNVGLYLLSAISARDFGWASTPEILDRVEATLATMQRLQRFRGHFYNWYDTRDLRPLEPRYISSVDSGNLAAHLIAVANTCQEWIDVPCGRATQIAGVTDAIQLTREALQALTESQPVPAITLQLLERAMNALVVALHEAASAVADFDSRLMAVAERANAMLEAVQELERDPKSDSYDDLLFWTNATIRTIESWQIDCLPTDEQKRSLEERLTANATVARALALAMEFDFLFDSQRKLLSIGYVAAEGALDPSCYDLLASEARLASFFAIAKEDVPARHWFRLGRAVTPVGHGAALMSWSGSMFEYLMPSLVMRAPAGSLLERTSRLIVRRQISYGDSLDLPWGISESAYSARDLELTYQYSNFGVPGLGLKRGLSENVVIAPYATALATMVDPSAAVHNFARLAEVGALGRYGFYEALDYTRSRLPQGVDVVVVQAFMAHHQGMTIVAIANVLFDGTMRARFHAESSVQATELLLQERTPRNVSVARPRVEEFGSAARINNTQLPEVRRLLTVHDSAPQTHLLSSARYAVMLTGAGSGYSQWRNLGITRWREDPTRDDTGNYIYLRDVASGAVWSAGYQPCGVEPDSFEVTFAEDHAEFNRSDGTLTTTMQVVVSPEDDAEVRRVLISNTGVSVRDIDVTSYCELVLAPPAADTAHPAFSKLFVQTEHVAELGLLVATRRRRSDDELEIWAAHHVVVEGEVLQPPQFETDRAAFLGRGREVHAPAAVVDGQPLSNTTGTVLDPIFALRNRVRVPPGATVRLSFWTEVASSRAEVLNLFDRHHDPYAFSRAATLAWTQAQVQLRYLGVSPEEASLFQRLAGHIIFAGAAMRPSSEVIQRGANTASALWAQGISGDMPIVLLKIEHVEDINIVRQLLRAHEYWRLKHLDVDLVILNERGSSYVQDLQLALEAAVRKGHSRPSAAPAGGASFARGSVFVLRTDLISEETRAVLSSVARVVFIGHRGSLADQLDRARETPGVPRRFAKDPLRAGPPVQAKVPGGLEFFNGLGGFAAEGREYVTSLDAARSTPAPWINVVSNRVFGFQIATEGSGYTWSVNSRENQITQWSNDPVTDRPGEVLYVRDNDTGDLWGPTMSPIRSTAAPFSVRHGQGYSRFEHNAHGIALDLLVYVPLDDPIKIYRLKICNVSQRRRRLTVTAYVEWVLGTTRAAAAPYVVTEMDSRTGAMFARNPWSVAFGSRVAFADLGGRQTDWTGDRREFLGRHGRLAQPVALKGQTALSKRTGAGLDPCCVLQAPIDLKVGESAEIVFFLGEAASRDEARTLLAQYRTTDLDAVLQRVNEHWDDVLGIVQVETPDRSMDIMLNRWMLYQTLACRMQARSAFYQASGAFGFRDQLQDGMALVTAKPAITREHLLRAAGRQFAEGDVQHWWLPRNGQGVRTRISDDRIWLAYATAQYLKATGDRGILDELVPFIEGITLGPLDHDAFFQPVTSSETATLFEHCARGLDSSLTSGQHGLPLIGTGDWNDGMNRVGEQGRGESVWLGWFLHAALHDFASVAIARNEQARSTRWLAHASALREALEREGWDGGWYRRGFFDDGTPLGSAANDECRIDSIAQSWSVISEAADALRATKAMCAVDEHLIRPDDGLALLFTPPFDRTVLDPGYVKAYPPGIRENGGQYTHAAAWSVMAFAKLGYGDKAAQLFSLLNPINHSSTATGLMRYKVEPYVVAADVYSIPPHTGRGGWTWYTGSAAWLYRAGIEGILGFHKEADHLVLTPCIPKAWPRFRILFRHGSTPYDIAVENPDGVNCGVARTSVDGVALPDGEQRIRLLDDGSTHHIQITLG